MAVRYTRRSFVVQVATILPGQFRNTRATIVRVNVNGPPLSTIWPQLKSFAEATVTANLLMGESANGSTIIIIEIPECATDEALVIMKMFSSLTNPFKLVLGHVGTRGYVTVLHDESTERAEMVGTRIPYNVSVP